MLSGALLESDVLQILTALKIQGKRLSREKVSGIAGGLNV
jgi:hypothetical protein